MTAATWDGFYGNRPVVQALERMIAQERIPQTLLFAGPQGIGKATAARRFAARLLSQAGDAARVADLIERDDLSRQENETLLREREKWPAEKRNDEPLFFGSHPDFLSFVPDGPLRQISIHQMRLLKERGQYQPSKGRRRVFLVDQLHRANEQASNSLLKILEEPPPYLVLIVTTENYFDVLPTIRSRAVAFHFTPLADDEVRAFLAVRSMADAEQRALVAQGSPGAALSLDLEAFERRRAVMLAFLRAASAAGGFGDWVEHSEKFLRSNQERLEDYLGTLYLLLADLVHLRYGAPIRNRDAREELERLAERVPLEWLAQAIARADQLALLVRRNIQKGPALDAAIIALNPSYKLRA